VEEKLEIINKTREKAFGLDFSLVSNLKNDILGKAYNLSIAYVGEKTSKELNTRYRNKNKSTNVLSFSITKNEGELIICPKVIKREYKNFDRSILNFLGFLIIHGMLHLKGLDHGSKMEKLEKFFEKKHFPNTKF
jgi:rRNA maturation RNase YbeY